MTILLNFLAVTVLAVLVWLSMRGPRDGTSRRDR